VLCNFRQRHLEAWVGLFRRVLMLCRRAGLVAAGHGALDGTKIKAPSTRQMDGLRLLGSRQVPVLAIETAPLLQVPEPVADGPTGKGLGARSIRASLRRPGNALAHAAGRRSARQQGNGASQWHG
jgi:hypothetical protein